MYRHLLTKFITNNTPLLQVPALVVICRRAYNDARGESIHTTKSFT